MREILFRGKRKDNGEWVEGGIVQGVLHELWQNANRAYITVFPEFLSAVKLVEVDPATVGQYTGFTEFVMADKSFNKPLFEGDIVEINSRRRVDTGSFWIESRSQYDGDVKARAVIVFENGSWRLDYNNDYNNSLCTLKGNEQQPRTIISSSHLYSLGFHGANEDWTREHNQHYKWDDIIKIGNIHDNPELLGEGCCKCG